MFRSGDKVRCVDDVFSAGFPQRLKVGQIYTVTRWLAFGPSGGYVHLDEVPDTSFHSERFVLVEEPKEEPKIDFAEITRNLSGG